MRDYRKRGDRMAVEKIGGTDRHATVEGRIDMSVSKLARLIGRHMAREMFEADDADDGMTAPLMRRKRSDGP
ncbi:hypothetical protein EJV44_24735 [Ancylobacter aquaticus]|nr:hypothetical protein EJV44_24735 [Ancylobacter aquaticus]